MEKFGKPILGVFLKDAKNRIVTEIPGRSYKGISLLTPERAVKVLSRMVAYRTWLNREERRQSQ